MAWFNDDSNSWFNTNPPSFVENSNWAWSETQREIRGTYCCSWMHTIEDCYDRMEHERVHHLDLINPYLNPYNPTSIIHLPYQPPNEPSFHPPSHIYDPYFEHSFPLQSPSIEPSSQPISQPCEPQFDDASSFLNIPKTEQISYLRESYDRLDLIYQRLLVEAKLSGNPKELEEELEDYKSGLEKNQK